MSAAATQQPSLLERLTGADKLYAANMNALLRFSRSLQGDPAKALAEYHQLPKELQESKSVMLSRFVVASNCQQAQPEEYAYAIADFRRLFPRDPCLELICLDTLIKEKLFDRARASLDKIQGFTGGDPYLDVLRGGVDLIENSPTSVAAAKRAYRAAADAEPTLAQAYWGLVTVSQHAQDFAETVAVLDEMRETLNTRFGDLAKIPKYAEFVNSEAYRSWRARQSQSN